MANTAGTSNPSLFLLIRILTHLLRSSDPHRCGTATWSATMSGGGCWKGHLDLQEVSGSSGLGF
ncbi:hypothetical protein QJS10_CPA01g01221 [Acorus calamus]|uniref:Uncharacterized protein n=1 Tax=Acorus calamus TaxID=4465 RepID=A0AAV9FM05_ACOCL|nr:hypothetical protein QJS10_CPA01g01221 [Acorus calamus]